MKIKMTTPVRVMARALRHPLFEHVLGKHHGRVVEFLRLAHIKVLRYFPKAAVGLLGGFIVFSVIGFYFPARPIYKYESETCFSSIALFPGSTAQSESFSVIQKPWFSFAGLEIFSKSACMTAHSLPKALGTETLELKQFSLPFTKKITVSAEEYPRTVPRLISEDRLSTQANLVFDVSGGDGHALRYTLNAGAAEVPCMTQGPTVSCKTSDLALGQGMEYAFTLHRFIGQMSAVAFEKKFVTVEPVSVAGSTIAANSVVYGKPLGLELALTKPLKAHDEPKLTYGTAQTSVAVESALSEDKTKLTIAWAEALIRGESYVLTLPRATAEDGGYLDTPYVLPFMVSVGPKVTDINIGSYEVSTDPEIVLTFDQQLSPDQDISLIVSVDKTSVTTRIRGNQLIVYFDSALPRCTPFTLRISDALQSVHGIAGGNAYEFSSRTICQVVGSIGTSVQGRSIKSYAFGNGDTEILYLGATHGNEKSTKYLLDSWVDYLEQNPSVVPSDKRVVIIPVFNPDAFAAGSRTNANNVDLNRNFPANNWKSSVKMPDGNTLPEGGGATVLSEPESQALASYVQSHRPRFTLTYHSWGSIVMGNGTGDSFSVAADYADATGYGDGSSTSASTVFTHDTTGAFEDWLHDKESMPALLIELNSHTSNEFWRHRQAMLDVLAL